MDAVDHFGGGRGYHNFFNLKQFLKPDMLFADYIYSLNFFFK